MIEFDLRYDLLNHLLKLSPKFFDNSKVGDLISRASYDIEMIRMFLSMGIIIIADVAAIVITTVPILFMLNPGLTAILCVPLPIFSVLAFRLIKKLSRESRAVQDHTALLSADVQEIYSGSRVIKSYNREKAVGGKFEDLSQENVVVNMNLARTRALFICSITFVVMLIQAIVFWLGSRDVIFLGEDFTLGALTQYNMYVMWVAWPMAYLGWGINNYQRAVASMERLKEIMDTKPEIFDGPDVDPGITSIKGDIEFRHLTFSYDKNPVLNDISLKIPSGKTLAVVGRTGCGKSTLVHLLVRLYNPPPNSIYIDGHELYTIPLETLRRRVGFVTQEPLLFSQTIAENIALADEDIPRERIYTAARLASIHNEISEFPKGYETLLGERGVNISGGQKQRTTMARALAGDPTILILDDALASVDTKTEDEILANLREIRKGRTCIIISHRISSVKDADIIVVIEQGRVAEMGNHEELIKLGGYYFDLNRRQQLTQELEKENGEGGQ